MSLFTQEMVDAALGDALIEHLDFAVPCTHPWHETHHEDEPAKFIVAFSHPACGRLVHYALCPSGWRLYLSPSIPLLACLGCNASVPNTPQHRWIVETLS